MTSRFLILFSNLLLITLSSFAQSNNSDSAYDFDKVKPNLIIENNTEAEKIRLWIAKNVTYNHPSSLYTKECNEFLSEIPDEIDLGMEEVPGTMEKEFKEKWASKFDMNRIIYSPFELGNGGCSKINLINLKYIGSQAGLYYYNVSVYCNTDKANMNKLIIAVLQNNGKYLIASVMNQEKRNYFLMSDDFEF